MFPKHYLNIFPNILSTPKSNNKSLFSFAALPILLQSSLYLSFSIQSHKSIASAIGSLTRRRLTPKKRCQKLSVTPVTPSQKAEAVSSISLTQHPDHVSLGGALPPAAVAVILSSWQMVSFDGGGHQSRPPQFDRDQDVQDRDDRHGRDEEEHRRYLEGVLDQDPLDRAPRAVHDRRAVVILVNDAELDRLRHGQAEGQQPNHDDKFDGAGQVRHRVGDEGMADGHVPGRNMCF